jgi:very-short-patch-repair endonuclease
MSDEELRDLESRAASPARDHEKPPKPFESWFEVDVYLELRQQQGYRVRPQFESAGKYIDLVVEGLDRRLAVECDGDESHGLDQLEADLTRQRKLERCGWVFWRIRGSDFYRDRERAVQELCEKLERMDIVPVQREAEVREKRRVTSVSASSQSAKPSTPEDETTTGPAKPPPGFALHAKWRVCDVSDPRTGPSDAVANGLLSIVNAEGPVTDARAYSLYAKGARLGRVGGAARHNLDIALGYLMRQGKVRVYFEELTRQEKERVIVAAGSDRVVVRTLGDRSLHEVPLSELAAVIQDLERNGYREETPLFRRVLELFGCVALTHAAVLRLRAAKRRPCMDDEVPIPEPDEPTQRTLGF